MAVTALLFDLDGCLVDSWPSILRCWELTLPEFGGEPPLAAQLPRLAGPPVDEVARYLMPGADEPTIAAVVARYRRCSLAAVGDVPAFPGVPELLHRLRERGVALGLATSKSIEVAEPLLESLGLRGCFEVAEGTRVGELGTDKATVVGRVLARMAPLVPIGLVGDREHDIRGAHAHRIGGFGALWGYGSREELTAAGADRLLAQPADVACLALGHC